MYTINKNEDSNLMRVQLGAPTKVDRDVTSAPAVGHHKASNTVYTSRDQNGNIQHSTSAPNTGHVSKPVAPTTTLHTGAKRATIGSDGSPTVENLGTRSFNAYNDSNNLDGFLSTGRLSNSGLKIQSEADIRKDTVFNVNGMEVQAWSLAKAGLLVEHPNGSYSLPSQPQQPQSQQQSQQQQEQEGETMVVDHLSPDVRTTLDQIDAHLGSTQATEALVGGVLGHMAGDNWEGAVEAFAQRTGVEPAHAAEVVSGLYENAYNTAAAHVTKTFGVNGDEVFTWIRENVNDKAYKSSLAHRIYYGDSKAFKEAVDLFKRGNRK